MSEDARQEIRFESGFYKGLDVREQDLLSGLDQAVELYLYSQDAKRSDAPLNFEKAVSILTVSFVKLAQTILKEDWKQITPQRKAFLNFGITDPRLMQNRRVVDELFEELARPEEESMGQFQKFYMTEWLEKISRGAITLTSDAAQTKSVAKDQEQHDRIVKKIKELQKIADEMYAKENEGFQVLQLVFRDLAPDIEGSEKVRLLKALRQKAGELETIVRDHMVKASEIDSLRSRLGLEAGSAAGMDTMREDRYRRVREEFDILVTVMKSCSVRGGIMKSTPVLIDKWLSSDSRITMNTKSYVEEKLKELEQIDPTVFTEKNRRVPPKVLILPGIGIGMAWTDRLIMPVFGPPMMQPEISLARTLGGYRWYRATSAYKWQDIPGELGSSFKLLYPSKSTHDLQRQFIDDYVNWMTKEAVGYQVLAPEVRKLFWRQMPFSKELKEKLYNRAAVYRQLMSSEAGRR